MFTFCVVILSAQQLMLNQKQAQSPKKAAGKSPILGFPLSKQQMVSTKPSVTPSKNAAKAELVTPKHVVSAQSSKFKSAKKQLAVSKGASKQSPAPTAKQNQSPKTPTPTTNGDQVSILNLFAVTLDALNPL